jgi:hypothetical protein
MKIVQRYQIASGALFATKKEAEHYLDVKYADAMGKLAHPLCQIGKYGAMAEFIHENLHEFAALLALRDDQELEEESE